MPDKKTTSVPFESSNMNKTCGQHWVICRAMSHRPICGGRSTRIWNRRAPGAGVHGCATGWVCAVAGWVTATACVLIGFGAAQLTNQSTGDQDRLVALEQNIDVLNRELILDRLQDEAAGTRLAGVYDARYVVRDDVQIAHALLQRATTDRSSSVRSAAIDALGPQLKQIPSVAN